MMSPSLRLFARPELSSVKLASRPPVPKKEVAEVHAVIEPIYAEQGLLPASVN